MQSALTLREPVQNFPEQSTTRKTSRSRKKPRKVSDQNLEQFLTSFAEQIRREQDKLRKLTEMSMTLQRRFRGLTLSDLCGHYGIRIETQGRWLDYDPELDGEIHPINIVQPAIRSNTNACLQSHAEINVESANASAKMKKISERWQKVAAYLERFTWTEEDRAFMFDAIQKDGTILIQTTTETRDGDGKALHSVKETGKAVINYQCEYCGASGTSAPETVSDTLPRTGEIDCPECGNPAQGGTDIISSYELDETDADIKIIKHRLVPFLNFVIDSYGAKSKGIESAKWLELHELIDRSEIETEYPQFDFPSPNNWSYQLQCDYALASGDFSRLNTSYTSYYTEFAAFDKFERSKVYLHESAYSNWVCPEDYEFINGRGEKTFDIKQGETIGEAQERFYGENRHGFLFVWIDDRLRDIVHPDKEEINFRKCFTSVHWLRDSSGFHSSPNYSIVTIQDDITLLNTKNHNIVARNAHIPVYYDSLVWDESDMSQEYIGTEKSALLENRDIKNSVFQLPIPTPSPHLQNQLQFLFQVKDTITLVQPAMRGEQQKGETYGAQRQQLEQSYGLLTSALKSFAQAKVKNIKQKFEFCKKFWTLEQFQAAASMEGEDWTDDDVTEMCEADFESDLIVDYRQGSEMPESNLSREMKFNAGLQQVMGLVSAGAQLAPDIMNKILAKIDEFADFDFDLSGLEVDELVSQKRIFEIYALCAEFGDMPLEMIELAKSEIAAIDPETGEPITKLDDITEKIFSRSTIRFSKYENLEQQAKAFVERLRAEIGADRPNYLAIEMLTVVLGLLEQAAAEQRQEEMEKSPEYQAQMQAKAEAEQMMQQQLAAAAEADAAEQMAQEQSKQAAHDADLEKEQFKLASQLLLKQNEKEGGKPRNN